MIPILYDKNEYGFQTQGYGAMSDVISCRVTEERNGLYELEMVYPATGIHFDMIQNDRIIYCRHSDEPDLQPFRIYKISKPLNGRVPVYARHISYDLSKTTVMPCEAGNATEAFEEIKSAIIGGSKFDFWTDKSTVAHFEVTVPSSVRSILGGQEGSVLDAFGGGEYEFDHFQVKFHANRGTATDVTIRYGKNIENFTQELDTENVITGVAPFWQGGEDNDTVITLSEGAVIAGSSGGGDLTEYYWDEGQQIYRDENGEPYANAVDTLGIVPLDLSTAFENPPTEAQLRSAAVAYLRANTDKLEEAESIKVSFVHLWQTEEYKNVAPLQRLRLCDTAKVYFPRYEVSVTAKVVRTVYNVLLERYDEMELGDVRSNFAKTFTNQSTRIESVKKEVENRNASMITAAINHATQMIQGGLGGHVVMKPNANGEPEEILIMDTDDIATAVNVIRLNKNGIAFSRNGYNGTYRTGWTIDGNFVADFITTGTLNANLIKTGTMSADRILGGTMKLGGSSNKNGILEIFNSSNQRVGRWDADALYLGNIAGNLNNPNTKIGTDGKITTKNITINGGSINIGDKFMVTSAGALTANSLTANDYINVVGSVSSVISMRLDTNDMKNMQTQLNRLGLSFYSTNNTVRQGARLGYYNGNIALYVGNMNGDGSFNQQKAYTLVSNGSISMFNVGKTLQLNPALSILNNLEIYGPTTCRNNLDVIGALKVFGTKNRIVKTKDYGERLLYSYETPSPLFGDIGEGTIGEDGKCYIQIDSIFAQTVTLTQYQVFLEKYGDGDCWVDERNGSYFVVEGTPGLKFGWEIKAKQSDFDQYRLEKDVGDMKQGGNS